MWAELFWAGVAIVWGGFVYAVRRWRPSWWLRFEALLPADLNETLAHFALALPSVVFGGLVGAIKGGGNINTIELGAVVLLAAPIGHHLLKWLPGPYQGAVRDAVWREAQALAKAKLGASLMLLLALLGVGCAGPARTPAQEVARAQCNAAALQHADERGAKECPDHWSTCPAHDAIVSELKASQERCDAR